MLRTKQMGLVVDTCAPCRGIWFDVGELGRACHIEEPVTLAAKLTGADDPGPDDSTLFGRAVSLLLGAFLGLGAVR